ncbi:hypothetical protein DB330_09970 [Lacticaseibacillus casei]|nr:hypothetical protein [Lacticaseibacillus casei]PTU93353.1 hypothetical protein DB330_09970 [Lacticaseibacillus casei]PTU93806.1 hypothetical protein DB326_10245 [Lacticaseibacillus casei]
MSLFRERLGVQLSKKTDAHISKIIWKCKRLFYGSVSEPKPKWKCQEHWVYCMNQVPMVIKTEEPIFWLKDQFYIA